VAESTERNSSVEHRGQPNWLTVLTLGAPVVSAIVVAILVQSTNLRVAELDREAKQSAVTIEQNKLRDQQETRRQQFMNEVIPKLLNVDDTQRRIGRWLLYVNYANDAPDILAAIPPSEGSAGRQQLQAIQVEAEQVRQATGEWTIVISGDQSVESANKWAVNAIRLGSAIYFRDGVYRTTVGRYSSRQEAEVAAVAVRPVTRSDAYPVALGRWCPNATARPESGVPVYVCGKH
jgi:hypothetical protein